MKGCYMDIQAEYFRDIDPGDRVVIIDDWLIQGTSVFATKTLIEKLDATVVGIGCVINNMSETRRKLLGRPEVQALLENYETDAFQVRD